MSEFLKKLEAGFQELAQKFSLLLAAVWGILLVLVVADLYFQVLGHLTGRAARGIGKWFGSAAVSMAIVAFAYYVLREAYVQSRRRKIQLPPLVDQYLKSLLTILRLFHPLAGSIAAGFAATHFYIMRFAWAGTIRLTTLGSGVVALGVIALLAAAGFYLRLYPAKPAVRSGHRVIALLFIVFFLIHGALA